MAPRAGERLGPYETLGGIGAGERGEACRARDTRPGRLAAVKMLLWVAAYDVFNHPIRYPDGARNLTLVFTTACTRTPSAGSCPTSPSAGRRIVPLAARFEF